MTKHVPSHIYVEGHRVLASYDGQPTCYGCGEVGHLYPTCPTWRTHRSGTTDVPRNTYAAVVAQTSSQTLDKPICPANGTSQENGAETEQGWPSTLSNAPHGTDLIKARRTPPPPHHSSTHHRQWNNRRAQSSGKPAINKYGRGGIDSPDGNTGKDTPT
jgi:hypothetical protein